MPLTLRVHQDLENLFDDAAGTLAAILEQTLRERELATFVLSGGTTPKPVYERLSSIPQGGVDWTRVHFFWGDERCVPPESPQSNYHLAWESLLSRIPVPKMNVHRMRGEDDPEEAALGYESEIGDFLRTKGVAAFDLVLLGLGEDGHTASLFPQADWGTRRLVVPTRAPVAPENRISMTPLLFNQAGSVLFLTSGRSKAHALAEVLAESKSAGPASLIRPASGRLFWLVDEAAASGIQNRNERHR